VQGYLYGRPLPPADVLLPDAVALPLPLPAAVEVA
jgi:hypothetical protein